MKIEFERVDEKYPDAPPFKDALILPDDHNYSDAEIEAMKDERFASHMAVVNAPSTAVKGLTAAQVAAAKASYDAWVASETQRMLSAQNVK